MTEVFDAVLSRNHPRLIVALLSLNCVDEPGRPTHEYLGSLKDNRFRPTKWTPLYALVVDKTWYRDKPKMLRSLLDWGAKTEELCVPPPEFYGDRRRQGTTALVELVFNFYKEHEIDRNRMISCLISHGANLDVCDQRGDSILVNASSRGNLKLVEKLIENGVKKASYDEALHSAAFNGRVDVARFLVGHGASTEIENENGYTAGDFARMSDSVQGKRAAQEFGDELDNVPEVRRQKVLNSIAVGDAKPKPGNGSGVAGLNDKLVQKVVKKLDLLGGKESS